MRYSVSVTVRHIETNGNVTVMEDWDTVEAINAQEAMAQVRRKWEKRTILWADTLKFCQPTVWSLTPNDD